MINVGVFGPGPMGLIALRGVIDHPKLRLTKLVVHSEHKKGRDAGELCGIDPVGVAATDDPDELLDADVDVVYYAATGNLRPAEAVDDMARILRTGRDVVSCSVITLVFPQANAAELVDPLRAACAEGASSCYTSGIDPGFANDALPLTLSGMSRDIESIRVSEIFNYGTYPQPEALFEILGFGRPPEFQAVFTTPGVLSYAWGPVLHQLADGLGEQIQDLSEHIDYVTVEHGFDTPNGPIPSGTVGAMRSTLTGVIDGEPKLVLDHVTRMHDDLAPEWPQPTIATEPRDSGYPGVSGKGGYRVEISGSPDVRCDLELVEERDHDLGARVAGATLLVNAIPAVRAAAPGLRSVLDLPRIAGTGLLRHVAGPTPDSRAIPATP
ncbi:hypothetical protein [Sciscionella marina]|uniref:NAD(P)H-dependent amine dehydrogenase family protein n=1 Tax=Sciscionella marina TaxID=508770 RepID=UPI000374AFE1|nr:hypothetical protein [Sciscionella marina]